MDDLYKNPEACSGAKDGTPMRKPMNKDDDYRPLVYICSPYSGDPPGNIAKAIRYSRFAVDKGAIPIAPHLLLPLYMDEEKERNEALSMDLVILGRCDELWVFGDECSAGMKAEIREAGRRGMKIRYFSKECREVQIDE